MMKRTAPMLALLLLLVVGLPGLVVMAQGGEEAQGEEERGVAFESKAGYALTLPKGWEAATAEDKDALLGEAARQFPNLKQIDLRMIDMFAFDTESGGDFATNVNVVRIRQSLEITDANRKEYAAAIEAQFEGIGIKLDRMTSRIDAVGKAHCITTEMFTQINGMKLYQRGHLFSDDKQAYIITFSTLRADQKAYAGVFDKILESFKATKSKLKAKSE